MTLAKEFVGVTVYYPCAACQRQVSEDDAVWVEPLTGCATVLYGDPADRGGVTP